MLKNNQFVFEGHKGHKKDIIDAINVNVLIGEN
jgi:hypothetical protein